MMKSCITIILWKAVKYNRWIVLLLLSFTTSCEHDYYHPPTPLKVGKETPVLEASYTTATPITLAAAYWKNANWKKVTANDLSTSKLYSDGMLNMTGTYNGKTNFNNGSSPEIIMKAAYDEQKIYLLVEWRDSDFSPAIASSTWDGAADPLKPDTAGKWTSQNSSDKLALAFDISNAANSAGIFSAVGCAATCHNNSITTMKPTGGKADLWSWDFAISEPLGYARDMVIDASAGIADDAGQSMLVRNKVDVNNNRSAPAYEYNGIEQYVTRPDGKTVRADPAFFLLNKTPFTGDPSKGKDVYYNSVYGCAHCHSPAEEAPSFQSPTVNRRSRAQMADKAENHDGASYYFQVPVSERDNLMAYIRGLGSLPGYYLTTPTGSNADIWTVSNLKLLSIDILKANTKYQVLFIRNLLTVYDDDVQFSNPEEKEFTFGIALMDADGKNHIGSNNETLKFLKKQ